MKGKKAVTVSNMIVTTILIILGFVIVVFFITQYGWKEQVDRQTCHQSILLRNSFNLGYLDIARTSIPLKCQTEKYCFVTSKSEDCEKFVGQEYEKVVADTNEKAVNKIANLIVELWGVKGEGKLQVFTRISGGEVIELKFYKNCLDSARLDFSKEFNKKFPVLTGLDFQLYQDCGGISCWDYLSGRGASDIFDARKNFQEGASAYSEIHTNKQKSILFFEITAHEGIIWLPFINTLLDIVNVERLDAPERLFYSGIILVNYDLAELSKLCDEFHNIP